MPTVKAKVIPQSKAKGKTVIVPNFFGTPAFRGSGQTSYVCGNCQTLLVSNIRHGQLKRLVIKCPACGAYNQIP